MAETRNKYAREFKIEAVRLLNTSGKGGHEIEADLGIGNGSIYRWCLRDVGIVSAAIGWHD